MTDTELYTALYDMTEARLLAEGKSLGDGRTLCLDLALCPPGQADALALSYEEDSSLFLQKTYLTMLQRPIDDGAMEQLSKLAAQQKPEEFRTGLVNGLKSSEEFAVTRCELHNDLYADQTSYAAVPAGSYATRSVIPERLLRVYRKMPESMKKAAKKILGAG